ncbi:tolloid-like protein 2 isoform X2 [Mya arenaria]|uniref:tolloid-like protein 2 isoform X2 n=1 Tax=Mya arenaria TaxID=6604 RepID=UPI0022E22E25|nr:tolloid-like protein 2 isoform X2 [Mya arenaria]
MGYLGKCMNHNCPTETVCVPAQSGTKTRYSCLKQDSCKNAKFCPVPSDADMYLQPSNIVEPICNGITIIDGGPVTLKSPDKDGDGYYDNLVDCVWKSEVSSGHIKITTQAFKLEWKIDCGYDWLTIRDNGTEHGPFCGTTIMSELTSISLDLEVVFRTDINSVSTGFSFTVENV